MAAKKFTSDEWLELFTPFWKFYPPRKGVRNGKPAAKKAWMKVKEKTLDTYNDIAKAVRYFMTTEDWTKENGKYIPMGSSFINQEKWDLEFTDDMEKAIADSYVPFVPVETEDKTEETPEEKPIEEPNPLIGVTAEDSTPDPEDPTKHLVTVAIAPTVVLSSGSLRQQYLSKLGYGE